MLDCPDIREDVCRSIKSRLRNLNSDNILVVI